jgi:ubiquinone/menaquinone biosynthesis C-methylase UbiE
MSESRTRVCPASRSWGLDNIFRNLIHPPKKIFGNYIHSGDTVIDIGCGPGFFTKAMARMVGENGRVIAVDLQEEMLEKMRQGAVKEGLIQRIRAVKASEDSLNLPGQLEAEFALTFYIVHEVPDKFRIFRELWAALMPGGILLIVEPSMHVTEEEFLATKRFAEEQGFRVAGEPRVRLSRARLLEKSPAKQEGSG